jgi:hypothetical protein
MLLAFCRDVGVGLCSERFQIACLIPSRHVKNTRKIREKIREKIRHAFFTLCVHFNHDYETILFFLRSLSKNKLEL